MKAIARLKTECSQEALIEIALALLILGMAWVVPIALKLGSSPITLPTGAGIL